MKPNGFFIKEINAKAPKSTIIHPPVELIPKGKVQLKENHTVPLLALPKRVYRVRIKYPKSNQSVGYDITARTIHITSGIISLEFWKDNYFTHGKTPSNILEMIDIACAKTLYPINLIINYNTNQKYISNLPQIKNRFATHLPNLQKDYKGELFSRYIQQIEHCLSQPALFTHQLLSQDTFFALFSQSIYRAYTPSREVESEINFKIPEINRTVVFKGKQSIDENYNNMGGFYIRFNGIFPSIGGKQYGLQVEYNLDYADYSIKDIIAEIKTTQGDAKETLSKITCYQLREKEPSRQEKEQLQQQQQIKQMEAADENEKNYQKYLRSKRSWIDKLFNF